MTHSLFMQRTIISLLLTLTTIAAMAQTFAESFEQWPGTDPFWLPAGWELRCSDTALKEPRQTWFVNYQSSIYAPAPVDGKVYAEILYCADKAQDEWIVSPAITPVEGDFLSYFVTFIPFNLFDITKYSPTEKDYTERIEVCNLRTYISMDGGEWQQINSLIDDYWTADAYEMRQNASEYVSNRKLMHDMTPYVGHSIRVAWRYTGKDGDSMFLDDIRVGRPTVKAAYTLPRASLFTPEGNVYLPDDTRVGYRNVSSLDATDFQWQDGERTTTDTHFTPTYTTGTHSLPTLTASGAGGATDSYTDPHPMLQAGGKVWASNADPTRGKEIVMDSNGKPVFGVSLDPTTRWTELFAANSLPYTAFPVSLLNGFEAPDKPYLLRGLTIQGKGTIAERSFLYVTVHRLTEEGNLSDPIAKSWLKVAEITTDKEGVMTLPFHFADPITVDDVIFVQLAGFEDGGVQTFAPLMTQTHTNIAHAYLKLYVTDGKNATDMLVPTSYLEDAEGEAYNNDFYFTLNMAYSGADDWGHEDQGEPQEITPTVTAQANAFYVRDERQLTEDMEKPIRSGFYDEANPDLLTLTLCAGNMDYSADVESTWHFVITLPRTCLGQTLKLQAGDATFVKYYDLLTHTYAATSTSGTLKVDAVGEHAYNVALTMYDHNSHLSIAANYTGEKWTDASLVFVQPNEITIGMEQVGLITSCVIEMDANDYRNITLTTDKGESALLRIPADRLTDWIWGFSVLRNDDAGSIIFRGNTYNYSSCNTASVQNAMGGNIRGYVEENEAEFEFHIYSVESEDLHNVNGFYHGPYTVAYAEGISDAPLQDTILTDTTASPADTCTYDLQGRRTTRTTRAGLYIQNRHKRLIH